MDIIKQYNQKHNICYVTDKTGQSSFGFLTRLFNEVQKDFPQINPDDVRVTICGQRQYDGNYMLLFTPPSQPHSSYDPV